MSDCRFGVSPVNYPDPDPDRGQQVFPKSSFMVFSVSETPTTDGKASLCAFCIRNKPFMMIIVAQKEDLIFFVLEFYGPVNNEVMSSRSVNSGTVPGQA